MPPQPTHDPTQPRILRTYTVLHQLRRDWGGSLILSLGLDPQGAALSIAANIAGAVSLTVDNNPTHLQGVVRTGACDFVVNTPDEAIRAMKNEVRKHSPLSVALSADPYLVLAEMEQRGLAPELFTSFLPPDPRIAKAATHFHGLGATLIDFHEATPPPSGFRDSQSLLIPLLQQQNWTLRTFTFDTPAALRAFDTKARSLLPSDDTLRRRWLDAAPRILQRQRPPQRSLWLAESDVHLLNQN